MGSPRRLAGAREHTGNRAVDAMQARARRTEQRVNSSPFLLGTLRSVSFAAMVPKVIDHGLNVRAAFFIARHNYDDLGGYPSFIEDPDQSGLDAANQLRVIANADCVVDLWLYPVASEVQPR